MRHRPVAIYNYAVGAIAPQIFIRTQYLSERNRFSLEGKCHELELELIQTQMAQKPMLRAEVGMRVRCANKASAE